VQRLFQTLENVNRFFPAIVKKSSKVWKSGVWMKKKETHETIALHRADADFYLNWMLNGQSIFNILCLKNGPKNTSCFHATTDGGNLKTGRL
jgi:hypothetical protein